MEKKLAFTLKLSGTQILLLGRWRKERARGGSEDGPRVYEGTRSTHTSLCHHVFGTITDSNSGLIVLPAGKSDNKEKNITTFLIWSQSKMINQLLAENKECTHLKIICNIFLAGVVLCLELWSRGRNLMSCFTGQNVAGRKLFPVSRGIKNKLG